jgi:urea carboxylase-associated protein 1
MTTLTESTLLDTEVPASASFSALIGAGETLSIIDLGGNQAVDFLVYDAADTANRYSAAATIAAQRSIFLTTGSVLRTGEGAPLMTVVTDTCGRHDTIGGACGQESNVIRYGMHTRHQHACRQTFLQVGAQHGIGARELGHNINFFMNVPVSPNGDLRFADGLSAPGKYVEVQMDRDVLVLISNCPQLNNPCNGWNPTPVRLLGWW